MKMKLPAGHARRLFLGFTFSIMFLVVFGLLIAHNTEAESASFSRASLDNYPLTIGIPTADPELTINFYTRLGFKQSEAFSGGLDKVCMEKEGSPYKLEICHNRFTAAGPLSGGVSGMSFKVKNLSHSVEELRRQGIKFVETNGTRDGVIYASMNDPNGISIKLFEN